MRRYDACFVCVRMCISCLHWCVYERCLFVCCIGVANRTTGTDFVLLITYNICMYSFYRRERNGPRPSKGAYRQGV